MSLTTSPQVKKLNLSLGFHVVPLDQLADDPAFWEGCKTCRNYAEVKARGERCCCEGDDPGTRAGRPTGPRRGPVVSEVLAVGIGGFLGAICRHLLSSFANRTFEGWPAGTLTVNVIGCLAAGILWTLIEERGLFSPPLRLLLTVGFLGGLTTFSAFGHETVLLLRTDQVRLALANVALNVVLCLTAVILGRALVKTLA